MPSPFVATRTLRLSEVFLSIQGEGPSAGSPAHFIRLQGCDVGCIWCDTKYSWDPARGRAVALERLWDEAAALGAAPLLVVTGGEPLQHPALDQVLDGALARWTRVEVETSGIAPPPRLHEHLHYNVSPKLPAATPRWRETWRHTAAWLSEPRATFKIVIAASADLGDFETWQSTYAVPAARIMLMPEGMDVTTLHARAAWLGPWCAARGLRLSPRLHIERWGARRGV